MSSFFAFSLSSRLILNYTLWSLSEIEPELLGFGDYLGIKATSLSYGSALADSIGNSTMFSLSECSSDEPNKESNLGLRSTLGDLLIAFRMVNLLL